MEIDIFITILLFVFTLIYPKSKRLAAVFFIFMWLLWGFNTFNGDYIAYEDTFLSPDFSSSPEFGYLLLNSVVGCFTSSYQVFLALMSLCILFVMYRISSKYSPYPALFALIYFLIFLMEFVFNRNYIVTTIFLCALLTFSQTENNKYFIVLVLLGCTVHSFCFLYIFFLPCISCKLLPLKKSLFYLLIASIAIIITFNIVLPYFGSYIVEKVSHYQSEEGVTNSSYALIIIVILSLYAYHYSRVSDKELPTIMKCVYNINIFALVFVSVFYFIPYAASRFMRLLFVLDLLFLTFILSEVQGRKKIVISLLFIIFIWFVLAFFMKSTFPYTVIPLYKCNLIFGNDYYVPSL